MVVIYSAFVAAKAGGVFLYCVACRGWWLHCAFANYSYVWLAWGSHTRTQKVRGVRWLVVAYVLPSYGCAVLRVVH